LPSPSGVVDGRLVAGTSCRCLGAKAASKAWTGHATGPVAQDAQPGAFLTVAANDRARRLKDGSGRHLACSSAPKMAAQSRGSRRRSRPSAPLESAARRISPRGRATTGARRSVGDLLVLLEEPRSRERLGSRFPS
jgi:hypothetical protein